MVEKTKENQWVILVGIDFYISGRGSIHEKPLRGCVRDINRVEQFFVNRLGVPSNRITKLTASQPQHGENEPLEPPSQWPTYENIVTAIQQVTRNAIEDDAVYFHYSGHGSRVATILDKIKGEKGIDETLIPTNFRCPEGRYLRDVELAALLADMVNKKLTVTIVLDSCYSGGATRLSPRADNVNVRGLDESDLPTQNKPSLIPYDQLVKSWSQDRLSTLGTNWFLEARGYTLLAACRANETAKEVQFDGEYNGVFTYWLLNSLELAWPQCTYQMLQSRIRAKAYEYGQTPILAGEGDRMFFGIDRLKPFYSINVLGALSFKKGSKIVVDAGHAHGMSIDTELALYSRNSVDFSDLVRIGIAKVINVQDVHSTAVLVLVSDTHETLESGCQAIVLRRSPLRTRYVKLIQQPNLNDSNDRDAAVERVRVLLSNANDNTLALETEGTDTADFQIRLNDAAEYEVLNSIGVAVPHLPVLKIGNENAPEMLIIALRHLAIYKYIRDIENPDPASLLANKLDVRLLGKLPSYHPPPDPVLGKGESPICPFQLQNLGGEPGLPEVVSREWVVLRIANLHSTTINITVLNLQPSWAITQIYPSTEGTDLETLDPGQHLDLPLQMTIPESLEISSKGTGIVDILKVFATVEPTSFRWLQLPDLRTDEGYDNRSALLLDTLGELEAVLALSYAQRPASRPRKKVTRWISQQVMIRTTEET